LRNPTPENFPRRIAALLLALGALTLSACGEKEEPDLASLPPAPQQTTTTGPTTTTTDETETRLGREAEKSLLAYFTWIDRGQGERLCKLIDRRELSRMKLPVKRGGCGQSLTRSIGFKSRKGRPVFKSVNLREWTVKARKRSARVVATVAIRFADRPQASIEDDVVYLERRKGDWFIAKPSATLYRAIGAEVPASAHKPPR